MALTNHQIKNKLIGLIDLVYPVKQGGGFDEDPVTKNKAIMQLNIRLYHWFLLHGERPMSLEELVSTRPEAIPAPGEDSGASRFTVLKNWIANRVSPSTTQPQVISKLSHYEREENSREAWSRVEPTFKNSLIESFFLASIGKHLPITLWVELENDHMNVEPYIIYALEEINKEIKAYVDNTMRFGVNPLLPEWYNARALFDEYTPIPDLRGTDRFEALKSYALSLSKKPVVAGQDQLPTLLKQNYSERKISHTELMILGNIFAILQKYPRATLNTAIEVYMLKVHGIDYRNRGIGYAMDVHNVYEALKKAGIDVDKLENLQKTGAQLRESMTQALTASAQPMPQASSSTSTAPAPSSSKTAPKIKPTGPKQELFSHAAMRIASLYTKQVEALRNNDLELAASFDRAIAIDKAYMAIYQNGGRERESLSGSKNPHSDMALMVLSHMRRNSQSSLEDSFNAVNKALDLPAITSEEIHHLLKNGLSDIAEYKSDWDYRSLCAQDIARLVQVQNPVPSSSTDVVAARPSSSFTHSPTNPTLFGGGKTNPRPEDEEYTPVSDASKGIQ